MRRQTSSYTKNIKKKERTIRLMKQNTSSKISDLSSNSKYDLNDSFRNRSDDLTTGDKESSKLKKLSNKIEYEGNTSTSSDENDNTNNEENYSIYFRGDNDEMTKDYTNAYEDLSTKKIYHAVAKGSIKYYYGNKNVMLSQVSYKYIIIYFLT